MEDSQTERSRRSFSEKVDGFGFRLTKAVFEIYGQVDELEPVDVEAMAMALNMIASQQRRIANTGKIGGNRRTKI